MIKLESLINLYWWMDPNGNLHKVPMTGHKPWAIEYLKSIGKYDLKRDVYDEMYTLGWARICLVNHYTGEKILTIHRNTKSSYVSRKHEETLKDLAREYNADEIKDVVGKRNVEIDESVLTEGRLRGEWWLDNHGSATFADGDVGDVNHEGVVIDYLVREFLGYFGIEAPDDGIGEFFVYQDDIKQNLVDEGDIKTEEDAEDYDNDPAKYMLKVLEKRRVIKDKKQLEFAFFVAFGNTQRDAREYALVYWKWKRVKDMWVETWNLTSEDMKIIYSGLWDAYGEELNQDDEEESPMFNMEVRSNNTRYYDIPIEAFKTGNPMALFKYRNKTDIAEEKTP